MIEGGAKARVRALILPWLRRRWRLAELGEGFHWPRGFRMRIGAGSRIGRFAYLGAGFEAEGPVVVGDLCMIAAGMKIIGADHRYDVIGTPTRLAFPDAARPVTTFGMDVWTGLRVTVMEGVTVGRGAVIGSGAIVTRDVPPYAVMAGIPARFVRWRFDESRIGDHEARVKG
ncbi:acyltransferase [Sphingomonas jatrophae]|uniref:Hexapeptide repeat of succinyl-transferase n=1 Tax=Sphingomonas jatrophae TaxID=1166337 RepID=A0A1I6M5E4_9SPHN|nr:acyltransferase [Sphingomonas jatrophae]SFS10906.1 Hexapeptide repeat of succinyl-transferase [Sphingomonas jatrophae]